jgi:hypothetical protein
VPEILVFVVIAYAVCFSPSAPTVDLIVLALFSTKKINEHCYDDDDKSYFDIYLDDK